MITNRRFVTTVTRAGGGKRVVFGFDDDPLLPCEGTPRGRLDTTTFQGGSAGWTSS